MGSKIIRSGHGRDVASLPHPIEVLTCAECCTALLERGASLVSAPRVGSLLDRCAVHAGTPPHAMRLVSVLPEVAEEWRAYLRTLLKPPPVSLEDARCVATIAGELLASETTALRVSMGVSPSEEAIGRAVETAREILRKAGTQ